MIALPPGCTVNYPIFIEIDQLTDEIVEWYRLIGGTVTEKKHWNHRSREQTVKFVQYGRGKICYRRQDGTEGVRLHFNGEDAAVASMFIIKFMERVETHNLKEHEERQAEDKYFFN